MIAFNADNAPVAAQGADSVAALLQIIADPKVATEYIATMKAHLDEIATKTSELQAQSRQFSADRVEADKVYAARNADLEQREKALAELHVLAADLDRRRREIEEGESRLAEHRKAVNQRELKLNAREESVHDLQAKLSKQAEVMEGRIAALAEQEKDYAARIAKLREIVR